ncbi:serine-rich adhesin for platelets [Aplysia californica]|uniref:Serine-rich adhesin for platelets n=1 Tax=Aplysia californica TaxID=6500 RepID=A0ABM1A553_APLCA|nr:serine-rich adhesin for platelets [Aplysia californica]
MDEDSDVDKELDSSSLADLHHGLDSSLDESRDGASGDGASTPTHDISTMDPRISRLQDDQVALLQEMVQEMKQEFQAAFTQLAKLPDRDSGSSSRGSGGVDQQQQQQQQERMQQQQRQLDDLTEAVHAIKSQLSALTLTVEELRKENSCLRGEQENMRERLANNTPSSHTDGGPATTNGHSRRAQVQTAVPRLTVANSQDEGQETEWRGQLPEVPVLSEDGFPSSDMAALPSAVENEVTALACRSLSLTQALGEKCLNLNLSESSDEEGEENRRASHYTPRAAQATEEDSGNRRHSLPSATGLPSLTRNRDVDRAAHRQRAVKELADSERDYCSRLWSLLNTYLTPLQTAGFLSAQELDVLFPPYLDQLYAQHCHICTGLQDRLVHWTHMGVVADLLSRVTESHSEDSVMNLYREYVEDLPTAVTCLRRALSQSPNFKSFLKAIKQSSCEREDLFSLLLAPVQHLPKYLLQLQQIARPTPPTHPDYPLLQTTLRQLQSFVERLNVDLSAAMQDLARDSHVGSSADTSQTVSARDSGINSTEEDMTSARAFAKSDHGRVLPEWLEDPYYDPKQQQHHNIGPAFRRQLPRPSVPSRMGALSQPDLTAYSSYPDPRMFSHVPRSQSVMPTGLEGSGEIIGPRARKFKVRKRQPSPSYNPPAPSGHEIFMRTASPRSRPSSAIDFLSHSNTYHSPHYNDSPARAHGYPGPQPRPHSALGPYVLDSQHRPTIISRKHLRRSQPPMPTSNDFMLSSHGLPASMPSHSPHMRGPPLSAHDLLPSRPSPYPTATMLDVEDDEDDTRASDSHSLATTGSHHHSSSHGSNDGHELDLDLIQHRLEQQGGRSGRHQPVRREFSSEEVTQSLAEKLWSDANLSAGRDMEDEEEEEVESVLRGGCEPSDHMTSIASYVEKSTTALKQMAGEQRNGISANASMRGQREQQGKDRKGTLSTLVCTVNQSKIDSELYELSHSLDERDLSSSSEHNGKPLTSSRGPPDVLASTNGQESSPNGKYFSESDRNGGGGVAVGSDPSLNGQSLEHHKRNGVEAAHKEKQRAHGGDLHSVSKSNQQFLLSLTQKSIASGVGASNGVSEAHLVQKDYNRAPVSEKLNSSPRSAGSHTGLDREVARNGIDDEDSSLNDAPSDSQGHSLPSALLRGNKYSPRQTAVTSTSTAGRSPRLSQPLPPPSFNSPLLDPNESLTVSEGTSKSSTLSTSSLSQRGNSPVSGAQRPYSSLYPTSSSSSSSNKCEGPSSSSSSSHKSEQMSRDQTKISTASVELQLHNNSTHTQLFSTSLSSISSKNTTGPPLETAIDSSPRSYNGETDDPDHLDLPPLEVTDLSQSTEVERGKKRDGRKKGKDVGKYGSDSGPPKAAEDPVSARKKMHLKASIKNLFTKKRGRVILADVEREVVMEMASAATARHQSPPPTSSPTATEDSVGKKGGPTRMDKTMFEPVKPEKTSSSDPSAFEIKTRKDQCSSTSSPVKVNRQLHSAVSAHDKTSSLTSTSSAGISHQVNGHGGRSESSFRIFGFPRKQCSEIFELSPANTRRPEFEIPSSRGHGQTELSKQPSVQHFQVSVGTDESHLSQVSPSNSHAQERLSPSSLSSSPPQQLCPVTQAQSLSTSFPSQQTSHTPQPQDLSTSREKSSMVFTNPANCSKKISSSSKQNEKELRNSKLNEKKSLKREVGPKELSQSLEKTDKRHEQQGSKPVHCQKCLGKSRKTAATVSSVVGGCETATQVPGVSKTQKLSPPHPNVSVVKSEVTGAAQNDDKISATPYKMGHSTSGRGYSYKDRPNIAMCERVKSLPYVDDPVDFCFSDCLKPCADAILLYETSQNKRMTSSYPLCSEKQAKIAGSVRGNKSHVADRSFERPLICSNGVKEEQVDQGITAQRDLLNSHIQNKAPCQKDLSQVLSPSLSSAEVTTNQATAVGEPLSQPCVSEGLLFDPSPIHPKVHPKPGQDSSTPNPSPSSAVSETVVMSGPRDQLAKTSFTSFSSNSSVTSSDSNNERVVCRGVGGRACPVVRHHDTNLDNSSCLAKSYDKTALLPDVPSDGDSPPRLPPEDKDYFQHKYRLYFDEDERLEARSNTTAKPLQTVVTSTSQELTDNLQQHLTTHKHKLPKKKSHGQNALTPSPSGAGNFKTSPTSLCSTQNGSRNQETSLCPVTPMTSMASHESSCTGLGIPKRTTISDHKAVNVADRLENTSPDTLLVNGTSSAASSVSEESCQTVVYVPPSTGRLCTRELSLSSSGENMLSENKNSHTKSVMISAEKNPSVAETGPSPSLPNGLPKCYIVDDFSNNAVGHVQLAHSMKPSSQPPVGNQHRLRQSPPNDLTGQIPHTRPESYPSGKTLKIPFPENSGVHQHTNSHRNFFSVLPYNDYVVSKPKTSSPSSTQNSLLGNHTESAENNLDLSNTSSKQYYYAGGPTGSNRQGEWMLNGDIPTLSAATKPSSGHRRMPIMMSGIAHSSMNAAEPAGHSKRHSHSHSHSHSHNYARRSFDSHDFFAAHSLGPKSLFFCDSLAQNSSSSTPSPPESFTSFTLSHHLNSHRQSKQPPSEGIRHGSSARAELSTVKVKDEKKSRSGKSSGTRENSQRNSRHDGSHRETGGSGRNKGDNRVPLINLQAGPDLLPMNENVHSEGTFSDRHQNSAPPKKSQSLFSKLAHSPLAFFSRDSKSSDQPK